MINKIAEKAVDVLDDMRWPGQTWENLFGEVAEVHSREEAVEFFKRDIPENGVDYIIEFAVEQDEEELRQMCEEWKAAQL